MKRHRRGFEQFSMSFLDAMSCGLGAVILIFMVINHASETKATDTHREIAEEVSLLEEEVLQKRAASKSMAAAIQETEQKLEAALREAASLEEIIEQEDDSDQQVRITEDNIKALKAELKALEKQVETMREDKGDGDATRKFEGEGRRQYLTGLDISGKRILILLDSSASMLGETIVDIIRRRNMSDSRKRLSAKWTRAVATVDWLTTQISVDADFQLYTFNTELKPAIAGTAAKWQRAAGGTQLNAAITAVRELVPGAGSSLAKAFDAANKLTPKPDSIFVITDGLPTQNLAANRKGGVSGRDRMRMFAEAVNTLPKGVPVNVILLPIEGDPLAASSFWQLAQLTGGSFMAPSKDWP